MTNQDDEIIEIMARAWVREEAAQMGEPDPWPATYGGRPEDRQFIADRLACARAQFDALRAAGMEVHKSVRPAQPISAPTKYLHLSGRACEAWARGWNDCRDAMLAAHADTAPDDHSWLPTEGERRAANSRVAIECKHGYDVCPECDGGRPIAAHTDAAPAKHIDPARRHHPRCLWLRVADAPCDCGADTDAEGEG